MFKKVFFLGIFLTIAFNDVYAVSNDTRIVSYLQRLAVVTVVVLGLQSVNAAQIQDTSLQPVNSQFLPAPAIASSFPVSVAPKLDRGDVCPQDPVSSYNPGLNGYLLK